MTSDTPRQPHDRGMHTDRGPVDNPVDGATPGEHGPADGGLPDEPLANDALADQRRLDAELWQAHDPTGIELATSIAHQTAVSGPLAPGVALPPPRGIRPVRRRRPSPGVQFSSAHPDDRDPQAVGDLLGRVIRERGWTTEISLRTLLARWSELVGPVNAQHSTPEGYREGVLTIRTESTTWATSLRTLAPNLVAELNRRLGQGTVTRVVVLGPQAPSWKHGPRSVPGRGPRDTYG